MKKLFVLFVIFFCFICFVDADEDLDCDTLQITKANICGNFVDPGSNCTIDLGTSPVDGGNTTKINETLHSETPETTIPGECGDGEYRVMVLLDDSGSMLKGTTDRVARVRNTLLRLVKALRAKSPDSKLSVRFFQDKKNSPLIDWTSISSRNSSGSYKINVKINNRVTRTKYASNDAGTNFSKPLKMANEYFEGKNYKPLVVFVTDGFPNMFDAEDEGVTKDRNLGYVSSARFFYKASLKLKKLANTVHSKKGKIVTISVDISAVEDTIANYFLNPNNTTLSNLASDSNDEAKRYYKMINGSKKSFKEAVASIRGKPDLGVVGWTSTGSKSVKFDHINVLKNNLSYMNNSDEDDGLVIGPFNCNFYSSARLCITGTSICKNARYTSGSFGSNSFYHGKCFYRFFLDSRFTRNSTTSWTFKGNKEISFTTYKGNGKKLNLKGSIYKSYPNPDSVKDEDWESIIDDCPPEVVPGTDAYCEEHEYIVPKTDKYNGVCVSKNYQFEVNYKGEQFTANLPYLILEGTKFSGGTLNNLSANAYYTGSGFPMKEIYVNRNYQFVFGELSGDVGIVSLLNNPNLSDSDDDEQNDKDGIYKHVKITEVLSNTEIENLKKKLLTESISTSKKNLEEVRTIDSNDAKNSDKDIISDLNEVSTSYNSNYEIKNAYYDYSRSDGTYGKFVYGSAPNGFILMDETKPNHYYIPYGYEGNRIDVKFTVNSRISDYVFKPVCSVNAISICNSPTHPEVCDGGGGGSKDLLTYRSINVYNPFPNSGYKREKIPFNWRDWYCKDSSICTEKNDNVRRLNSSYDNSPHYKIDLKDVDLGGYITTSGYDKFDDIEENGSSKFVSKYFYNSVNSSFYCGFGEFDETKCNHYLR